MNYDLITRGLLLAWIITNFTPLQDVIKTIRDKAPIWILWLFAALSCQKCMSLWITWAMTGDVFSGILAAVIAATYDRLMSALPIRL